MADNDHHYSPLVAARKQSEDAPNHRSSPKPTEFLSVSYSVDRLSGLRTNKKSNSFRVSASASLRSVLQAVIKKIKFSTRYRFLIIYFDPVKNSKAYLEWRKFKDNLEIQCGTPVKFRVCRYKSTVVKAPNKEVQTTGVAGTQEIGSAPFMQGFNPYFFQLQNMAAFCIMYMNFVYSRSANYMQ
jgi:hypothetical protein